MFKPQRSSLPTSPGVYLYKDSTGKIIYVGKAKNLRNRVSTYFSQKHENSIKTQHLVSKISDLEFIVVDNEVEALLLENRLIKKHTPQYNIMLKDSKSYAYIKLTEEEFPRILTARQLSKKGEFFGPFVDGMQRRELIILCVKLFKLRTCRVLPKRACLNYHINQCTAPCIDKVSESEYAKQVERARDLLKGKTKKLLKELKEEMHEASEKLQFERALERKQQLERIEHLQEKQKVDLVKNYDQQVLALVTNMETKKALILVFTIQRGIISGRKEFRFEYEEDLLESFVKMYYSQNYLPQELIVNKEFWEDEKSKNNLEKYLSKIRGTKVELLYPKRGEKKALMLLAEKNAYLNFEENDVLLEIQDKLNLPLLPRIIECFDMSNLGSVDLVGGMTRWVDAKPDKDGYRKFEIKSFKGKNDDFRSMHEVVYRRYRHLKEGNLEMPNLIIIDGGKGQLSAAFEALKKLELQIPIISLAKKEEEIFLPKEEESRRFPKNSKMMLFIRQVRDSVHTYVLSYNRKKREMRFRKETEE